MTCTTCKSSAIWTCKDGTEVHIRDMSNSHLLNTITMLERHSEAGTVIGDVSGDPDDRWAHIICGEEYLDMTQHADLVKERDRRISLLLL